MFYKKDKKRDSPLNNSLPRNIFKRTDFFLFVGETIQEKLTDENSTEKYALQNFYQTFRQESLK